MCVITYIINNFIWGGCWSLYMYMIGALSTRARLPNIHSSSKHVDIFSFPPILLPACHDHNPNHFHRRLRQRTLRWQLGPGHEGPVPRADRRVPGRGRARFHGLGDQPAHPGDFTVHQLPGAEEQLGPVLSERSLVLQLPARGWGQPLQSSMRNHYPMSRVRARTNDVVRCSSNSCLCLMTTLCHVNNVYVWVTM